MKILGIEKSGPLKVTPIGNRLYKVAESRGIRIHAGNTSKDSAGCVLVGMGRDTVDGSLSESKLAETMVTMLCRTVKHLCITEPG